MWLRSWDLSQACQGLFTNVRVRSNSTGVASACTQISMAKCVSRTGCVLTFFTLPSVLTVLGWGYLSAALSRLVSVSSDCVSELRISGFLEVLPLIREVSASVFVMLCLLNPALIGPHGLAGVSVSALYILRPSRPVCDLQLHMCVMQAAHGWVGLGFSFSLMIITVF